MAIEYKLSYTAAQIDERLGMVDNMVKTVNGVAPDDQGNVQITLPDSSHVDMTEYAKEQWVQDNYQPKGNYLTEHQDISGKLDADQLPQAVNDALAEAKESGLFDGAPGDNYVLTDADMQEIAEMAAEMVEIPSPDSSQNVTVEPAYEDRPKFFFGAPLQQTKDEIVTTFSYRSKTLSFDCYAEIKAQGNSTLQWPKKNQTMKLYKDEACTEKFKVDFKGWGKQNKFVIKANWRDLTHVRDIVSVRLEGDCMRTNPDYDALPELLRTSPDLGGIDGFPVVVYAAGVYQGRYMCNIPKDAWMANMDDELDTHCILCSEDYNSSCFRATANINGNDWTDEIHDTVPASIKTRWNQVISFVMNSTDEEFVANLDSYIKVSTLIDRHLMGLMSCDFDGYGKNQLYLTYDGQQWYAGRYDKDGTWGNYWSGDSMLPSDYGREQYEDFTSTQSDGRGNLLFIRLEQLFWARLQARWAELRVGPLSIPNIINRFRELYDITPPYVIAEDYASTTANGAFTGIPNKNTCTIQQIQKFVVERHAWVDKYMSGEVEPDEPDIPDEPDEPDTPGEPVTETLYEDYSPNGVAFRQSVNIDFDAGDYIEAEIDVSNVTQTTTVFSAGSSIDSWTVIGGANYHVCVIPSKNVVQLNAVNGDGSSKSARSEVTNAGSVITVKIDSAGVWLNGVLQALDMTGNAYLDPTIYESVKAKMLELSVVQVGASEGEVKSVATYNYIKVYRTAQSQPPEDDTTQGELPAEYTELAYIESNGTQYIDTGVSGGTNAAYEISMDTLGTTATNWEQYLCGAKASTIPKISAATSGSFVGIATSCAVGEAVKLGEQKAGKSVYAYAADGTMTVNGGIIDMTAISKVYAFAGNGWGEETWYVFNSHGEPNLMSSMRLYYLKMWTDGELVRDFVPALRNSDNVAGLYDLANGQFYENAGTGSFTYPNA